MQAWLVHPVFALELWNQLEVFQVSRYQCRVPRQCDAGDQQIGAADFLEAPQVDDFIEHPQRSFIQQNNAHFFKTLFGCKEFLLGVQKSLVRVSFEDSGHPALHYFYFRNDGDTDSFALSNRVFDPCHDFGVFMK
jgi:hypothetical protein